ncbi:response regulator [Candidatus Nitrospira salsa]
MLLQTQEREMVVLSDTLVKHILLVDDDTTIRECVREFLELQGYHCTEADNGFAALEELENNSFSLIITDNQMPVMDGISFLEAHHANEKISTPVIMVTGNLTPSLQTRAANIGVKSVFEKPCPFETLMSAISHAIEN